MHYHDRVYGLIEISDLVLLELMASKPLDRMKRVNQAGASQYIMPEVKVVSRYEHCVGAMLLLRQLGASVEEQIAGLLHDVPHTAFSHVIDIVFEDENHEFHERFFEKIVKQSEIPEMLQKHGFDVDRVINEHHFGLLEQPAPRLCADRCDYTLRDSLINFQDGAMRYQAFAADMVAYDGRIMMQTPTIAKAFMEQYMKVDRKVYTAPIEIAAYEVLAEALRIALKTGEMTEDDLFEDDDTAMAQLRASKNKDIHAWLDLLTPTFAIKEDKQQYEFHRKGKVRFIDPEVVMEDGVVKTVTQLFPEMQEVLQKHKEQTEQGAYFRIIR